MFKIALRLALVVAVFASGWAHAQSTLDQRQVDLVSAWLVTIDGEAKTRTLRVKGVAQEVDQLRLLDADYGFSDGKQSVVKAEILQIGQGRQLKLITQSDSIIVAAQLPNGSFAGTFTLKNGVTKAVRIEKISEDELRSVVGAAQSVAIEKALNAAPIIEPVGADVPGACAAFLGGWSGVWPNVGRVWLWVVSVDAKCRAKYSYGVSSNVPKSFKIGEIKDGVFTIILTAGTATFEVKGNEISGRYAGTDGTNAVMMQKVSLTDGSLAKLRIEQKANGAATAPAVDAPAECAAFFGGWTGTWSAGNFGQLWLRVVGVDANCVARVSYRDDDKIPRTFESVEIKQGVLSFICNKSTQGTCNFKRHGDDLWADYHNPSGGRNNAVFRKAN